MFLSIGMAAVLIGVSVSTLRRWEKEQKLKPSHRTLGGHRRYSRDQVDSISNPDLQHSKQTKAVIYGRVSSHDQKMDLERQMERLEAYASNHFNEVLKIKDLGSGLNFKKPGLKKLLSLIHKGEITHLILNHKDRLLRFGSR